MVLDLETLPVRDVYQWMVCAITPRPIAWVSTISAAGQTNLAPFSFFQGVCANPPTLLFVGANDCTGNPKNTIINVREVSEFVVNIVPDAMRDLMNQTASSLPRGESEFERFGIAAAPSGKVRPPRVAAAPVSFECRLDRIIQIGDGPLAGNAVFGRILLAYVNETVLTDGRIDPHKLDAIGRLGGDFYTHTREVFAMDRPA